MTAERGASGHDVELDITGAKALLIRIRQQVEQVIVGKTAVIVVTLLYWYMPRVMRFIRRRRNRAGVQMIRSSIRSQGSLLGNLRDLLPRLRGGRRAIRVDLRSPTVSVRDAYRKLLVLAAEEGYRLSETESPRDFARRLGLAWTELVDPVEELTHCYVAARYGDVSSDADLTAASHAWSHIRVHVVDGRDG